MNEMVRNFSNDKYNITDKFGEAMTLKILNFMREQLKEFQDRSGNLYNLEATPAEGTTNLWYPVIFKPNAIRALLTTVLRMLKVVKC